MTTQEIRQAYIDFFAARGHVVIPRALLVPQNDPSTLFTGSGMQQMVPYLLGETHPAGTRLTDSQPCFRAEDMDEVGDNRHTTFFEMLGNWSLGDYYKAEQIPWIFEFLTSVVGLDPHKLYVTCFAGDDSIGVPKDTEAADLWKKEFAKRGIEAADVDIGSEAEGYKRGVQSAERIFYYDAKKNWWSRAGVPATMPVGEPGGPSSEVFYLFEHIEHDKKWGDHCHPNCDCGRYMEIGNNVFMAYKKTDQGFSKLPKPNVDFGGGLERIAAAAADDPDIFAISLLKPIIEKLEQLSGKSYVGHTASMRVIADHMRAATFLMTDGVMPSNNEQGYVVRRLLRRAIRFAFELGIESDLTDKIIPVVAEMYGSDYPEVVAGQKLVEQAAAREEKLFRQTLTRGLREFEKVFNKSQESRVKSHGAAIFELYDTFGFPVELSLEEISKNSLKLDDTWRAEFDLLLKEQRERSRTAGAGVFKGGLADHSEQVVKYHTTTHLMYKALKQVLGDHVVQRGSNITAERLRFDFSHAQKVSREQLDEVERIVNQKIDEDLPVSWREENTKQALAAGVSGAFGDKYGQVVKVYTIGDPKDSYFSREICGGPHVEHTGVLAEGRNGSTGSPRMRFKISKEEASSAGVRRVKAILE